jgi:hypothetical protein
MYFTTAVAEASFVDHPTELIVPITPTVRAAASVLFHMTANLLAQTRGPEYAARQNDLTVARDHWCDLRDEPRHANGRERRGGDGRSQGGLQERLMRGRPASAAAS